MGRKSNFDSRDQKEIKRLYTEMKLSRNLIAKRFKVSFTTINNFLKKEGFINEKNK